MFLTFKLYFYIVCEYVLPANMYVFHMNEKLEEGLGSPGTGAKDGCELPRRCWKQTQFHWKSIKSLN